MKKEILEYLNAFKDNDYHELNDLIRLFNKNNLLFSITVSLMSLVDAKLIEIEEGRHKTLYFRTRKVRPDNQDIAILDKLQIRAKILETGRQKLIEGYDEAFPARPARTRWPLIILAISAGIALIVLGLKFFGN